MIVALHCPRCNEICAWSDGLPLDGEDVRSDRWVHAWGEPLPRVIYEPGTPRTSLNYGQLHCHACQAHVTPRRALLRIALPDIEL